MIEIISEANDLTTNKVIEWLISFKAKFQRLNFSEFTEFTLSISNTDEYLITNNSKTHKSWFRRGGIKLVPNSLKKTNLFYLLKKEERPLLEFYEKYLYLKNNVIGSYQEESLNNKILNLFLAKQTGLNIPKFLVTNKKKDLLKFFNETKPIITKCIFQPPRINENGIKLFGVGTTIVKKENIDFLSDKMSPTFVQEYIEKEYEVRTFFYKNQFYSMAIFSQKNKKTKIDYRNYDMEAPNRMIPFKLPKMIDEKIKVLIRKKNINTGSIDFIVTTDGKFVFLEINPQGQFDWLSKNCNYYIEKEIARDLAN